MELRHIAAGGVHRCTPDEIDALLGAPGLVWVDVKYAYGQVENWMLEGYPQNVLERTGWKKDVTIKVGDTLTFFGWRARDGSPYAHLREATLADGKKLYFGPPAGTGEGPATIK